MQQILIVEDSTESFELVRRALGQSYSLIWAKSLADAALYLAVQKFSLIILDLHLPDGDSFKLCSEIQSAADNRATPIIFLTARPDMSSKVLAFAIGADDYILKPFDGAELKARVTAKIRRNQTRLTRSDIFRAGAFELDPSTQRLQVITDGIPEAIDVTPFEFKILLYLVKRPDTPISRDEIKSALWGASVFVDDRSVDTHISKLRRKIGARAAAIKSHHGLGYSFHISEADMKSSYFNLDGESSSPTLPGRPVAD